MSAIACDVRLATISVGRTADNDIVLDGGGGVSSLHCVITRDGSVVNETIKNHYAG